MITNSFEFFVMNNPVRRLVQEHYEIKNFLVAPNTLKGKDVLEIGCGNGFGAKLINKNFHPKKIIGIDLDRKMIVKANNNKLENAKFIVGDAAKLKIESLTFDAVFDFGMIHHLPNWEDCLNETYRVLKKGGQIFIEDLSIETFDNFLGQFLKKTTVHPYEDMYRYPEFVDYLKKIGFKILVNKTRKFLGIFSYFVVIGIKKN